jgi:hypothetical protein
VLVLVLMQLADTMVSLAVWRKGLCVWFGLVGVEGDSITRHAFEQIGDSSPQIGNRTRMMPDSLFVLLGSDRIIILRTNATRTP